MKFGLYMKPGGKLRRVTFLQAVQIVLFGRILSGVAGY
jgi:hypothetical protein